MLCVGLAKVLRDKLYREQLARNYNMKKETMEVEDVYLLEFWGICKE
jgi:hypothetical protein